MTNRNDNKNYNYLFKYIIIGDAAVGKTNLLMRFTQNKFTENYQGTIGVEFGVKNIEIKTKKYRIQIWDTAGAENFRSITRSYYNNSVCAIVVYDITNRESFANVSTWIKDIQNNASKAITLVLIGNKVDLNNIREVTYEEGQDLALKNGIIFGEASAKTGEFVNDIFMKSIETIVRNIDENHYNLDSQTCGIIKGEKERNKEFNNKKNIKLANHKNTDNEGNQGCPC